MLEEKLCPHCGKNKIFTFESLCYTCGKEKYDEDMKTNIQSGVSETEYEDSIYCPYCGEVINPYETCDPEFFEEGSTTITCDHCEKDFNLEINVHYSYSTSRMDDEDDEDEDDEYED